MHETNTGEYATNKLNAADATVKTKGYRSGRCGRCMCIRVACVAWMETVLANITCRCFTKSSTREACLVDVIQRGLVGKTSVAVQRAARLRDRDARSIPGVCQSSLPTGRPWRGPPNDGLPPALAAAVSKRWTSERIPGEPELMFSGLPAAVFALSPSNIWYTTVEQLI